MEARLKIRSSDKSAERGHCRDMSAKGTDPSMRTKGKQAYKVLRLGELAVQK